MYTCNRCKKAFENEPAMVNGAGSFCAECEVHRKMKMAEAMKKRVEERDGGCVWCGTKLKPDEQRDAVCRDCQTNRDWLLKCIRHTEHVAKYVASREVAERESREARIAAQKSTVVTQPTTNGDPSNAEARLLRMETMLNKLMTALGE